MNDDRELSKYVIFLMLFAFPWITPAHPTAFSDEIQSLNSEFGQSMGHRIIVFDKNKIERSVLNGQSQNPQKLREKLIQFIDENYQYQMSNSEAENALSYLTQFKDSAISLPFFDGRKLKVCFVFPPQTQTTHFQQVKNVLGENDPQHPVYPPMVLEKAKALMSQSELQYFSLYHELSHCLDPTIETSYLSNSGFHGIHKREAFAEVHALMFMVQRRAAKDLGTRRAKLRGLFSRYMGPFLANPNGSLNGEEQGYGGSIYFLSPALLKAQQLIESKGRQFFKLNVSQTTSLALNVVGFSTPSSRSFYALHKYLQSGRTSALHEYRALSEKDPSLFYQTYLDLLFYDLLLNTVD